MIVSECLFRWVPEGYVRGMPDSQRVDSCGATTLSARATFPATLTSSGGARTFITDICREWELDDMVPSAVLVVTELVENAVMHGHGQCTVVLECTDEVLTIAVTDGGGEMPRVLHPASDQRGGRGLLLVDAIAQNWGYQPTATGKRVWADLALG